MNSLEKGMQFLLRNEETTLFNGDDSLAMLEELMLQKACRRVAVFTGRSSADRSGAWAALLAALRYTDCAVVRFKDIPAEPDMQTVENMRRFLIQEQPDCVIALGGGSVMDAAKAAYITMQTQLPLAECFGSDRISQAFPGKKFQRIIAIPTTSGTGSELTQYSNIVNLAGQVKQLISDPVLVPEVAVLRADFTASMPRNVTLATGCDALAHLLEGWLNVNMDDGKEYINQAAAVGVDLLKNYLPQVLSDAQELQARKAVQIASALGGLTIRNKSTGLPHLLSFSWFGRIEHGIAAARLLPAAWRYYIGRPAVAERTLEIASVLGGSTPEEVITAYEKLLDDWQVARLKDFPELTAALLETTCRSAGANRMKLDLAPRPVPLEASANILKNILNEAFK